MGKPKILSIDLETYSDVDLGKCGLYRYVEGDFHILLFAYAFDDEEVRVIDMAQGEQLPQEVLDAIGDPKIIKAAWNAQFERTCIGIWGAGCPLWDGNALWSMPLLSHCRLPLRMRPRF